MPHADAGWHTDDGEIVAQRNGCRWTENDFFKCCPCSKMHMIIDCTTLHQLGLLLKRTKYKLLPLHKTHDLCSRAHNSPDCKVRHRNNTEHYTPPSMNDVTQTGSVVGLQQYMECNAMDEWWVSEYRAAWKTVSDDFQVQCGSLHAFRLCYVWTPLWTPSPLAWAGFAQLNEKI